MKFKYAYIALILLLSSACERLDSISTPDFNVRVDTAIFQAGEEVIFHFSGDAGMITFYSGETGSKYSFRDGVGQLEALDVRFESHNQELADAHPEEHEAARFRVMLSTDFESNDRHYIGVSAATWTDITERFTIATPAAWAAARYVQSGAGSILDLVEQGEPFHIAFHYHVPERETTNNLTRRWRMSNFQLTGQTTQSEPFTLGTYSSASWALVSRDGPGTSLSEAAAANVLFAPLTAGSQASVDEWLVSPMFSVSDEQGGPSFGVGIKGYGNPTMGEYRHTYEEPGNYTVTFVAINENVEDRYEIVRQIQIIVLP